MEPNDYLDLSKGLHTFAMSLREYYEALINSGFTENEALFLTSEMQKSTITNAMKGNDASTGI